MGDKIYKAYLEAFPDIARYFKYVKAEAWRNGYVLISPITGHKAYIYDWEELKKVEARLDSDFWNSYRANKPLYNQDEWLGYSPPVRNSYIRQFIRDFSNNMTIQEIATANVFSEALIYVEIVKHFFKRKGASERMALNYPIQGSSAQITKMAAIKFFYWICDNDLLFKVLIPNLVHDEIMAECNKNITELVSNKLIECMEDAGEVFVKCVKLKSVPEIATYWKH